MPTHTQSTARLATLAHKPCMPRMQSTARACTRRLQLGAWAAFNLASYSATYRAALHCGGTTKLVLQSHVPRSAPCANVLLRLSLPGWPIGWSPLVEFAKMHCKHKLTDWCMPAAHAQWIIPVVHNTLLGIVFPSLPMELPDPAARGPCKQGLPATGDPISPEVVEAGPSPASAVCMAVQHQHVLSVHCCGGAAATEGLAEHIAAYRDSQAQV